MIYHYFCFIKFIKNGIIEESPILNKESPTKRICAPSHTQQKQETQQ